MAWRPATDFEQALLAEARARWPQTLPLARALCLAPRIEPLLLRNARLRFAPHSPAEVESLLWFSPLVAARGARECVLHLGVARLLAEEVQDQGGPDALARLWAFTRLHTRHWAAPERLERDLRYHALCSDTAALNDGLQALMRRMAATDEPERLRLARLAKRTLPVVAPPPAPGAPSPRAAGDLNRCAALTLSDGGPWVQPGEPGALPSGFPLPSSTGTTVLGVELRWDPGAPPVLHLTEPAPDGHRIECRGSLPVRLHLAQPGRDGAWHTVQRGTRIALDPPGPGAGLTLELADLEGRRWRLHQATPVASTADQPAPAPPPLLIIHVEADRAQAERIAAWLTAQGIPAEPLAETAAPPAAPGGPHRALRLWTGKARAYWASRTLDEDPALAEGLLLRLDDTEPPASGAGHLLDWRDWERLAESPAAGVLREAIEGWWRDGKAPEADPTTLGSATPGKRAPATDPSADRIAEILRRLENPDTEPRERLRLGDELAKLGDPRPGVGTVEREIPVESVEPPVPPPPAPTPLAPTEAERLIAELADPRTEPPRRLEIGDRLDQIRDPRRGVGVRADGLPDIDWVEIPGGTFIYQNGERRDLPTFWIARHPVTNRQYRAFIKDSGYRNKQWWKGVKQPKPKKSSWPQGNRPRTDIDWSEAVAFSRWLNARLGLPEASIRLPTEVEWERAARGRDGRAYPWGKEFQSGYANIDEKSYDKGPWYLQQTTGVGVYPQGASPEGVLDLSGNVWEWCLNRHKEPQNVAIDSSDASCVVRGGSWFIPPDGSRTASRYLHPPQYRNSYLGFRLCSSVPIS